MRNGFDNDLPMDLEFSTSRNEKNTLLYGFAPECNSEWSNLLQLRWVAGTLKAETGVVVRVNESQYYSNNVLVPDYYDFQYGKSSRGPMSYRSAYSILKGIRAGIQLAQDGFAHPIKDRWAL